MSRPISHGERPAAGTDDLVVPFRTVRSGVSGRLVRLGAVADTILKRHDYPDPVSEALGQLLALTAMLGSALKFEGRLIVQTKTDGPLGLLVVSFEAPGRVRGYASYDRDRWAEIAREGRVPGQSELLGSGHLAMTIDPGPEMERYQGIVALSRESLSAAALTFRQSEQLPTYLRLAVARHYATGEGWRWRAGGLMVQYLTRQGGLSARRPRARRTSSASPARIARTGSACACWRRRWRTTSCSTRPWSRNGCSTACSTRRACA